MGKVETSFYPSKTDSNTDENNKSKFHNHNIDQSDFTYISKHSTSDIITSPTKSIIQTSQQIKESVLQPDKNRFVLFPIKHHSLWEMYKKHIASFWTVDEVDLSMDRDDWQNKLNENERHFIQMILAFFAG